MFASITEVQRLTSIVKSIFISDFSWYPKIGNTHSSWYNYMVLDGIGKLTGLISMFWSNIYVVIHSVKNSKLQSEIEKFYHQQQNSNIEGGRSQIIDIGWLLSKYFLFPPS